MKWIQIESPKQISKIKDRSQEVPCLIFKHSTTCPISSMAKYRLEGSWDFADSDIEVYFLDLLRYRSISNQIAEDFQVHHQSPQIIFIDKGEVQLDASHLDISVDEVKSVYKAA